MKLIYILGLEHSGTTLTDHLLSTHPKVLGLGEINSFFSTQHMSYYSQKWGHLDDAYICSCGEAWKDCSFWGDIEKLSGLNSQLSIIEKYKTLLSHIQQKGNQADIVIDSSKSLDTLKLIIENSDFLNLSTKDIHVVYAVKDVRSFSASMAKKNQHKGGLLATIRSFNYWNNINQSILSFLENTELSYSINLYEKLCADPKKLITQHLSHVNLEANNELDINNSGSHIAMGNKDFTIRNKSKIKYDNSWQSNKWVKLGYLIHCKARRLNNRIYELSDSEQT